MSPGELVCLLYSISDNDGLSPAYLIHNLPLTQNVANDHASTQVIVCRKSNRIHHNPKCSICGPDKCDCNTKEVQLHGFTWERELSHNIYGAQLEELATLKYTDKVDLPQRFNRLGKYDLSIKTSHSLNTICMADCLRVFNLVSCGDPIHLVVINYDQQSNKKKITQIIEIDITNSCALLFGNITFAQIEQLNRMIKAIPQKENQH